METLDNRNDQIRLMSVGDWILTIFITVLPLIGLIMLFIWAFSENDKPDRANYAKASLIWMAVWLVLGFMFMVVFGGFAMLANMQG